MFCSYWRNKAKEAEKKVIRQEIITDELMEQYKKLIRDICEFTENQQSCCKFTLDAAVLSGYQVQGDVAVLTSLAALDEMIRKHRTFEDTLLRTNHKMGEIIKNLMESMEKEGLNPDPYNEIKGLLGID